MQRIVYGSDSKHVLEIYDLCEVNASTIIPILIFVHGGGWGSGQLWQYTIPLVELGKFLNASHVVLLGYPVYPKADMIGQKTAVAEGVRFLQDHKLSPMYNYFHKVDLTASPVILSGHSSGAHISALALSELILDQPTNRRKRIDFYLGIAGMYNILTHYDHECDRQCQIVSPMTVAAGGKENFHTISPHLVLEQILSQSEDFRGKLPYIGLVHGEDDTFVPFHSSIGFQSMLKGLGYDQSETKIIEVSAC
jgi:hypothetical protein